MDVEIIPHQRDGLRPGVTFPNGLHRLGQWRSGPVRRRQSEMPPGFRLYGAENIRGVAALVLAVLLGDPTWGGRSWGPEIGMP
jgi:hypothetical protein